MQDTDCGSVAFDPKELGDGTTPQKVPSQLSTSDCSVLPFVEYPTAVQADDAAHDTDCRFVAFDPKTLGVGSTCQEVPSQLSTSGRSTPPDVELPTAVQSDDPTHDTEANNVLVDPLG
jgi:hypothetical protein